VSGTRVARRVQAGVGVCGLEKRKACDGPWLGAGQWLAPRAAARPTRRNGGAAVSAGGDRGAVIMQVNGRTGTGGHVTRRLGTKRRLKVYVAPSGRSCSVRRPAETAMVIPHRAELQAALDDDVRTRMS
jgi:hypothetical protein